MIVQEESILVPDIIIDAIANGYHESSYEYIINLHNYNPEILSDEYNDIRDVMLLDDWLYDDMNRIEQWLNDTNKFIIPDNCFIGFNEHHGDFGMWEINDEGDETK